MTDFLLFNISEIGIYPLLIDALVLLLAGGGRDMFVIELSCIPGIIQFNPLMFQLNYLKTF